MRPRGISAAAPEADPDLYDWQDRRWSPHPLVPVHAYGVRSFRTDSDSPHARTIRSYDDPGDGSGDGSGEG